MFLVTTEEMSAKLEFVLPAKYCNEYVIRTMNNLYIFAYYLHAVHFCIFKFAPGKKARMKICNQITHLNERSRVTR